MNILITGFQRSGTSLLRRLIHEHPDVDVMLHETRILNKPKKLQLFEKNNFKIWGDKVPWNSGTGIEIIRYAKKWVGQFPEYRIIHIVRHPIDVANSNVRRGWISFDDSIKRSTSSVIKVDEVLNKFNYTVVCYEDLVVNPRKILKKIFTFCKLDGSDASLDTILKPKKTYRKKAGGPILSDRAYAYKTDGEVYKKVNYNKLRNLTK